MSYPKVGFPHGCIGMIYTKNYTPHYSTPSYSGHRSKYYFNVLPYIGHVYSNIFPFVLKNYATKLRNNSVT